MQSHQSMTMDDKRRFTTFAINFKQITQKLLLKRSEAQSQKSETSKYLAQNTCNSILFAYISDAEQVTGKIIIGNNLMFKMCSACQCPSFLNLVKRKNTKIWTIETDPLCYVRKRQEITFKEVENYTKCQFYSETIHFKKRLLLCKWNYKKKVFKSQRYRYKVSSILNCQTKDKMIRSLFLGRKLNPNKNKLQWRSGP